MTQCDATQGKRDKYTAIQGALHELLSAESSLHMYPDPIETNNPESEFLSEVDANAKHACVHMHAAFELMNVAHRDQEGLKTQVYKLVVQLRELGIVPKIKTWLDDE